MVRTARVFLAMIAALIAREASASPVGTFEPVEEPGSSPPSAAPRGAPAQPTDPYTARRYTQYLGPYHRPENATMPGYGDGTEEDRYTVVGDPHRYRHDGFYLRLAGGLGSASDSA